MTTSSYRLSSEMLDQAKAKAGLVPLGKIIRILIAKWLRGEIEITPGDVQKEQDD